MSCDCATSEFRHSIQEVDLEKLYDPVCWETAMVHSPGSSQKPHKKLSVLHNLAASISGMWLLSGSLWTRV